MDTLRECCNRGYARGACVRAAAIEPDAARFLVRSDREGVIEVAWAIEKNHHPVAVGNFAVDAASAGSGEILFIQAKAVATGYRRQKGRN